MTSTAYNICMIDGFLTYDKFIIVFAIEWDGLGEIFNSRHTLITATQCSIILSSIRIQSHTLCNKFKYHQLLIVEYMNCQSD